MPELTQMELLHLGEILQATELAGKKLATYVGQTKDRELKDTYAKMARTQRQHIQRLVDLLATYEDPPKYEDRAGLEAYVQH